MLIEFQEWKLLTEHNKNFFLRLGRCVGELCAINIIANASVWPMTVRNIKIQTTYTSIRGKNFRKADAKFLQLSVSILPLNCKLGTSFVTHSNAHSSNYWPCLSLLFVDSIHIPLLTIVRLIRKCLLESVEISVALCAQAERLDWNAVRQISFSLSFKNYEQKTIHRKLQINTNEWKQKPENFNER